MQTAGTITLRPHSDLSAFVRKHSGQNPLHCYQCGKCTAGCPVAQDMDLGPRQVMRAVQLGLKDEILSCNSIWVCLQCQMCSDRCPMDIDIARVMGAVGLLAMLIKHPGTEKEVELFERVLLEVVKRDGRLHELELGARTPAAAISRPMPVLPKCCHVAGSAFFLLPSKMWARFVNCSPVPA